MRASCAGAQGLEPPLQARPVPLATSAIGVPAQIAVELGAIAMVGVTPVVTLTEAEAVQPFTPVATTLYVPADETASDGLVLLSDHLTLAMPRPVTPSVVLWPEQIASVPVMLTAGGVF